MWELGGLLNVELDIIYFLGMYSSVASKYTNLRTLLHLHIYLYIYIYIPRTYI